MSFPHIYVATRFFETDPAKALARLARLDALIHTLLRLGVAKIGVAVNVELDRSNAIQHLHSRHGAQVRPLAVTPWGRFVPALQALLLDASAAGFRNLLCLSTEVDIGAEVLAALDAEVDATTLVAGLRMPGHSFEAGLHDCDGFHSPWNTAALWRIKNGLDRIGFASAGEALSDPSGKNAGVEEVSTIALYQKLYEDCAAVLLDAGGVVWNRDLSAQPASFGEKLLTKAARAAAQLEAAHLMPGRVRHRSTSDMIRRQ